VGDDRPVSAAAVFADGFPDLPEQCPSFVLRPSL
jgi:hypothetical protein